MRELNFIDDVVERDENPTLHLGDFGKNVLSTVYLMDCVEAMKKFPDKYFDLAVVDPPYGIGNFTQSDRKYKYKKYGEYAWNEAIPDKLYFDEIKRVSKKRIIWGANYYNCFENGHAAIIWDKINPHPSMSRCEIASVSWNKKVDYVQIMHYGAHQDKENFHPCGKPIKLYDWIFANYAKEGDLILDTHLGSQSSRIAAYKAGLDFVGFEIDKEYFDAGNKRFKNYVAQGVLF